MYLKDIIRGRCNMVKNFLKRTLCIVLSFAMMTGTVMVGAKTKTESIHSKLPAITASQRVRAKQAKASAAAVQLMFTRCLILIRCQINGRQIRK